MFLKSVCGQPLICYRSFMSFFEPRGKLNVEFNVGISAQSWSCWCWYMQDVARKIMSFAQVGPRVVCVMSASGAISNVTLRQQSTSGGTVTYQVSTLHLYGHDIVHSVNKKLSPSLALYDKRLQLSLCSGYKNLVFGFCKSGILAGFPV